MVLELEECVFACVHVCRVNTPEEREKTASTEFPPGPRLGQDETNRELMWGRMERRMEVRRGLMRR